MHTNAAMVDLEPRTSMIPPAEGDADEVHVPSGVRQSGRLLRPTRRQGLRPLRWRAHGDRLVAAYVKRPARTAHW